MELEEIPECFYPATGKNQAKVLHKIYFGDESYNKGHSHAYEFLGISPQSGAIVLVRPDQYRRFGCDSLDDFEMVGLFFAEFMIP
ncbi:hypothetical protein EYZ11_009594 [Aspergillus tanneri]|uniref:Phenol hydroxylase-like C-terminal dimerisation domain-containing protein n=1 Tax=Aspergillus tanneri TaxID=1220188 RepID=A0A4V6RQQ4_9EURO|nr:hypothetical protein EYZ11_009594 [Aspergillus tanneri]